MCVVVCKIIKNFSVQNDLIYKYMKAIVFSVKPPILFSLYLCEEFVTFFSRGEHLSTMYTHALWSTRARREHLLTTKYFTCRCERCADPTELGTHLGSLQCPCKNGLMLANDPLNPDTDWSCNACSGTVTSAEVAQLTDRLEQEVTEVMGKATPHTLSDLLSR